MNKTMRALKTKIEAIKKTHSEAILEMDNPGKATVTTNKSITNRVQEIEERLSGIKI